jgi:bacteriorhodopsin
VLNVSQVSKKYRNAVAVSAVVVAVAGYHYFRIFTGWADGEFNEGYRYADWLLTVPLLLIELLIVLGITSEKRRPLSIKLAIAAVLMIALGYPGEVSTSDSTKWIFWVLAMIPFVYILVTDFSSKVATKANITLVRKIMYISYFSLIKLESMVNLLSKGQSYQYPIYF